MRSIGCLRLKHSAFQHVCGTVVLAVKRVMSNIDWDAKSYPGSCQPVQLDSSKYVIPCSGVDWWSRRSCLCCACFPVAHCINGRCNPCLAQTVDALNPEIYKKTLQIKTFCPEDMSCWTRLGLRETLPVSVSSGSRSHETLALRAVRLLAGGLQVRTACRDRGWIVVSWQRNDTISMDDFVSPGT